MDQVAAQKLEGKTRFASLELGCEEGVQGGNCDNGYSCAYSNSISWRTPSSPKPPEIRPRAVFERLFGAADGERDPKRAGARGTVPEERARRRAGGCAAPRRRRSAARIAASWTSTCTAIREIETRIQKAERENTRVAPTVPAPSASVPTDFAEHARIMMDLLALAFQTDSDARGDGAVRHRAEPAVLRRGDRDQPKRIMA